MFRVNNVCLLKIKYSPKRCHEFQLFESRLMPGFCASIVLAFISGVALFDYVVDRENMQEPGSRGAKWGIWP